MPRKSKQFQELEAKYQNALQLIERMSLHQGTLASQLGAGRARIPAGQLVVGIRNISNYTVGLIDNTTGVPIEYNLTPEIPGIPDPHNRAVISYAFWQRLRSGTQVAQGLIMRDDSVLGEADNVAPADRPEDLAPDAAKNQVIDPKDWIRSKTEPELRDAIAAMTSGPSLRRLLYAIDQEIISLGEEYAGQPDRAIKALKRLPAVYRLVEELAEERLDELNPISKVRHLERGDLGERMAIR